MRYTRKLLEKAFCELTDDELKCIGKHFLKHPPKNGIKRSSRAMRYLPAFRCIHMEMGVPGDRKMAQPKAYGENYSRLAKMQRL